jgi:sec-independent protein translocase protein TatA
MNIFGIGLPEMAVIAAIGLLVFGPKRLPELGKTLGRTLKGFQSASQDFEKEFRSSMTVAEVDAPSEPAAPAALTAGDGTGHTDAVVAEASTESPQS